MSIERLIIPEESDWPELDKLYETQQEQSSRPITELFAPFSPARVAEATSRPTSQIEPTESFNITAETTHGHSFDQLGSPVIEPVEVSAFIPPMPRSQLGAEARTPPLAAGAYNAQNAFPAFQEPTTPTGPRHTRKFQPKMPKPQLGARDRHEPAVRGEVRHAPHTRALPYVPGPEVRFSSQGSKQVPPSWSHGPQSTPAADVRAYPQMYDKVQVRGQILSQTLTRFSSVVIGALVGALVAFYFIQFSNKLHSAGPLIEPVPQPPTPAAHDLVNWAKPTNGGYVIPESTTFGQSWFQRQFSGVTFDVQELTAARAHPLVCVPARYGGTVMLKLAGDVAIKRIVVRGRGQLDTLFDDIRNELVEGYQSLALTESIYDVDLTASIVSLHFSGSGCLNTIEVWGYPV